MSTVVQPTTAIAPSPEARRLYGLMVARSDKGRLSHVETLRITLERASRRREDVRLARELVAEGWAYQLPCGGWMLA